MCNTKFLLAALLLTSINAFADNAVGGGIFISIEDGMESECIDVSSKLVSMQVITLQVKRTNSWWKKSKSLGGKFDVTLTNADGKPFVFPRGVALSANDIKGDVAFLPVRFALMSRYDLVAERKPFVSVGLSFYVVNIEGKSGGVQALQRFIDFSKTLPLPPNPYAQGLQFFGDFANQVVNDNIQSDEEKLPVAQFSFDLAQNANDVQNCPEVGLRSGINAVMFELEGKESDGVLPIKRANNYCYWLENGRITFRPKSEDGDCAKAQGKSKTVVNPVVAFRVESWSKNLVSTTPAAVMLAPQKAKFTRVTSASIPLAEAKSALREHSGFTSVSGRVEPENVVKFSDLLSKDQLTASSVAEVLKQMKNPTDPARVVEAETARHLQLCKITDTPIEECN